MAYELADAVTNLDLWVAASAAIAAKQSYTINGRTLTLADSDMCLRQIKFWKNEVAKLTREDAGEGGLSIRRAQFNHSNR